MVQIVKNPPANAGDARDFHGQALEMFVLELSMYMFCMYMYTYTYIYVYIHVYNEKKRQMAEER